MTHGTNWCRQPTTSQSTRTHRRGLNERPMSPICDHRGGLGSFGQSEISGAPSSAIITWEASGADRITKYSGHLSIIVVEHSAKSLTPHDRSGLANLSGLWNNQSVAEPL